MLYGDQRGCRGSAAIPLEAHYNLCAKAAYSLTRTLTAVNLRLTTGPLLAMGRETRVSYGDASIVAGPTVPAQREMEDGMLDGEDLGPTADRNAFGRVEFYL